MIKTMYNYFDLPEKIIETAFNCIKDLEFKEFLEKNWNRKNKLSQIDLTYIEKFKKILKYIVFRYSNGYSLEDIATSIESNTPLKIKIMGSNVKLQELLKRYNIKYEELTFEINNFSENERYCYEHFYGIEKQKLILWEIATKLNMNIEQVRKNLICMDACFIIINDKTLTTKEKKQILFTIQNGTIKTNDNLDNIVITEKHQVLKKSGILKRKTNFLEYFDEKDRTSAKEILDQFKKQQSDRIITLIKLYGSNYDKLNKEIILTEKENGQIQSLKQSVNEKLIIKNQTGQISVSKSLKRKTNFLEYFEEKDRIKVKEILDELKEQQSPKIQTLIKLYGEQYNKLNDKVYLEKSEKSQIENLKNHIKGRLNLENNTIIPNKKKRLENFLEYFEEKDRIKIKEILDELKKQESPRIQALIKLYGEQYNKLNEEIRLNGKEKKQIDNLKEYVNKMLEKNSQLRIKELLKKYEINNLSEYELIIIKSVFDGKKITDISQLLKISIKQIEDCLIKNLILFEDEIPNILVEIINQNDLSTDEIINLSYLKEEILKLDDIQKRYIYLKLECFNNNDLTDKEHIYRLVKKN